MRQNNAGFKLTDNGKKILEGDIADILREASKKYLQKHFPYVGMYDSKQLNFQLQKVDEDQEKCNMELVIQIEWRQMWYICYTELGQNTGF